MRQGWLLLASAALAAGMPLAVAQTAGKCECGAHPPGPPRDRAVTPYAGEPADLSPYAKFAAPYDLNYVHPNIYSGAGRDVPEPKNLTEVRIGFFGPVAPNPESVFGERMMHGAQLALEESLKWAREREAFGKTIGKFQVLKHRLAEMATALEVSREFTYRQAAKMAAGKSVIKEISMAKNVATDTADRITYDAVQILGGLGYMRESLVERLYRDNRILSIGGGTREVMNEIISKQMGL